MIHAGILLVDASSWLHMFGPWVLVGIAIPVFIESGLLLSVPGRDASDQPYPSRGRGPDRVILAWSGWKPWAMLQMTAWVRLSASMRR